MRYRYLAPYVVLGFLFIVMIPNAHAATVQVTIMPGSGSGQYCEQTSTCFSPSIINISPGDTVTWTNDDNVAHTITDGLPFNGPTGTIFDSGPIMPTKTFSFTFQNTGTDRYFATESKWMVGEIIIGTSNEGFSPVPEFGGVGEVILLSIASIVVVTRLARPKPKST